MSGAVSHESELDRLRLRLSEAEQTLDAIRAGEVDSLLVDGPDGLRVYTLEGSSNAYRVLVEAMNEGAATLSEKGTVLYCNARLARLLGEPPHRVMGASFLDRAPARDRPMLEAILRGATLGEAAAGELSLRSGAGEEVPVYLSANSIESDGHPVICLAVTDLSGQAASREMVADDRLARSVLEHAAEAVLVCDTDGRVVRASQPAAFLCGGNPLLRFFDECFPLELSHGPSLVAAALEGQTLRAVPAVLRCAGDKVDLLASAGPVLGAQGEVIGCVLTLIDVTEHHRAEEALQQSDRRKSHFLAVLSHELRNPLTPIVYALRVLQRDNPGGDSSGRARAVIERQVAQLTRLVDDLLDMTRISSDKVDLQLERLDLNELVLRTAEDHLPLFEKAGVKLEVSSAPEPLHLAADRARLAQILGNLLTNAVKFTPAGGRATVAVERRGDHAVLRVTDTGVGIEEDLQRHLFEPFAQGDVTLDRSRGGLGLGLALARGLVELHGGSIRARSSGRDQGSEFTVELPVEEMAAANTEARAGPATPRKVLLIEDNRDAADTLLDILEQKGHEVTLAYDGLEGLRLARRSRPEVVFCDLGLPGLDGYHVARAIRADPSLQGVLLVALSGYAQPEDVRRAREAGFDGHLPKPPRVEVIEDVLERRGAFSPARPS